MNTIWIVLPILILLMFQLGMELDRHSFAHVAKHPLAVLVGLIGQLLLLPLLAFAIGNLFRLDAPLFIGLMLIACSPGGSSSNVFSMLAKGDVALSVTLTALSSTITLFTIPLVMAFTTSYLASHADVTIHLPVGKLLVQNLLLMFLPMLLGALFRRYVPRHAPRIHSLLGRLAFPALMLLAAVFFLQHYHTILHHIPTLGLCTGLLILLAMAGGSLLSRGARLSGAVRRTIVIEVGMQNAAQAITIATSPFIFHDALMATPAIVYALLMNIILLTYLKILPRTAATTSA